MSRSYCYTLNNYSVEEASEAFEGIPEFVRYSICGYEIGEEGTPHLQGYVELKKPQRLAAMKKWLPRAHWETRRGTRDQARLYCMKEGEWDESGDWKAGGRGTRNDIREAFDMLVEDVPMREVAEAMPELWARNHRALDKYQAMIERDDTRKFRNIDVQVLYGDAGSGKTRAAHEYDNTIFTVNCGQDFPFDGYDGEKTILLDDFYGDIKYSELLRILDGHQFRVNVKGGHRYAKWTKIFITSNKAPEEWYHFGLTPALKRRLSGITLLNKCDEEKCNEVPGNTVEPALDMTVDEFVEIFNFEI